MPRNRSWVIGRSKIFSLLYGVHTGINPHMDNGGSPGLKADLHLA
jgi:hypothetical protein